MKTGYRVLLIAIVLLSPVAPLWAAGSEIPDWTTWNNCSITVVEDGTFASTECLDSGGNSSVKFTEEANGKVFMIGWGYRDVADDRSGIRMAIITNEGKWVVGDPGMGYLATANPTAGKIKFKVFRSDGSVKAHRTIQMPFRLIHHRGEPV